MTNADSGRVLLRAFVVCLIMVSLPIKNFAYLAPAAYLLVWFLAKECSHLVRVFLLSGALLSLSLIAILWDQLNGQAVNFPGPFMALMTYAPILLLVTEKYDYKISSTTYEKLVNICVWFLIVQSLIGIVQYLLVRNTDAVSGTFGLLDTWGSNITIMQVYYTFTMFGMILFLYPESDKTMPRIAIGIGLFACILAQSGHQTVFLVLAIFFCGMLRMNNLNTQLRTLGAALGVALFALILFPQTLWLSGEWFRKVTNPHYSPKYLVTEGSVDILSTPKNFLIGTGLGQYTSRAALITSDEYLNVRLPSVLVGRSDYYLDHVRPANSLFYSIGEGSAMAKPYMTALSIPVELGIPLTLALLALVIIQAVRCLQMMWSNSEELQKIGFAALVGICFLVLNCTVENYAEFTQAIFLPCLLYTVAMSRAIPMLEAEKQPSLAPGSDRGWSMSSGLGSAT